MYLTKKENKEKYFALIFFLISFIFLLVPKEYKLKISLYSSQIFLFPLRTFNEYLSTLRNYEKERNYLYQISLIQNLILAELKRELKNSSISDTFKNSYNLIRAKIITRDNSLKKYLVIDKGLKDSVLVNSPCVTYQGLIGKVIATTDNISVVETYYSPYSKISAKIQRNNYLVAITSKNERLYLDYLEEDCDVKENDTIISSSIGGIFPDGLKIGVVKKVERKDGLLLAIVKPEVNLLKLDDVFILLRKEKRIKKDELDYLLRQLELKLPEIKFIK